MRCFRQAAAVAILALVAAGCGSGSPGTATGRDAPPSAAAGTDAAPSTSMAAGSATSTSVGRPSTTTRSTPPAPSTTSAGTPALAPRLADVGAAEQAVVVTAPAYGATSATLTVYERTAGIWRVAFGPWAARVGTRGLAPPGQKREGDGRTPSGVYGFDFFFGVAADPGVRYPYRRVTGTSIVWDDDPISPLYNEWVDATVQPAGTAPEPMYVTPAYDYGAVIAYNTARTPGLGSAIFLHVSTGGPTAGCVSLPADQLVQVLRWLDPGRQPRIVLGVSA